MTQEDINRILALGEECKAKGCKCRARCYNAFNRYWEIKAKACTHPNFLPPDTEHHGPLPPLVGNSKAQLPKTTRQTTFTLTPNKGKQQ